MSRLGEAYTAIASHEQMQLNLPPEVEIWWQRHFLLKFLETWMLNFINYLMNGEIILINSFN